MSTEQDELDVLDYEMQQRVAALRAARPLLETRGRGMGVLGQPTLESPNVLDLLGLAEWILTGTDRWAPLAKIDLSALYALREAQMSEGGIHEPEADRS